jgi:hypothetical protein
VGTDLPDILDVPILRPQAEMIEYDERFGAARGGNRAGKSIGWGYWLQLKRLERYPLAVHVVAGPSYENLRNGFFPAFCGILDSLGWEEGVDYRYVASGAPRIFLPRLHKHAKLHSLSIQLVGRIKGTSIQTMVLEEPQEWDTKDRSGKRLYEILLTRLSHSQTTRKLYPELVPQLRMSFNPPAEGTWLWKLIEEQWADTPYRCWRMSVRDNALLVDREGYVKQLEDNLDPQRQASEIDGHWATGGGNVYYAFDPKIHGHPPAGIPPVDAVDPMQPLIWSHDFNVGQMCSVIAQRWEQIKTLNPAAPGAYTVPIPGWQAKIVRFLAEICDPPDGITDTRGSSVPQVLEIFLASPWADIAREIQERTKGHGLELCGDPSGGGRSQMADARTAARRPFQYLLEGLRAAGIRVKLTRAHAAPGVKDSVHDVNAQFVSGASPNLRYGVTVNTPKLEKLIFDWRNLGWKSNGMDLAKKAGEVGDASDAGRYLISLERKPESSWSFGVAKQ